MKSGPDLRRIRFGIEISGRIKWYEGFNIKATGTKYANPTQNDCNATIIGIDMASRDYILTETSPFNANRTPKRLILEVGTVELGTFQLFVGDIFSAEPMSPPDVGLTIKANTQVAAMGKMVAKSGGESSKLSALAKSVADDLGLNLVFEATDKDVGNYQHTGAALRQVGKLQEAGGVSAYIDDGKLVVKDATQPLNGRTRILSQSTGMVGIPKVTEKGIKVSMGIDRETTLGGGLTIKSKFNTAASGDYVITQLGFEVATHDDPFFYHALAARL